MGSFLLAFADRHAHTHIHSHFSPKPTHTAGNTNTHRGIKWFSEPQYYYGHQPGLVGYLGWLLQKLSFNCVWPCNHSDYRLGQIPPPSHGNCWDQTIQEPLRVISYPYPLKIQGFSTAISVFIFAVVIENAVSMSHADAVSLPNLKTQGESKTLMYDFLYSLVWIRHCFKKSTILGRSTFRKQKRTIGSVEMTVLSRIQVPY